MVVSQSSPVLVATLGGKAQVLTFALNALLHQGISIHEVVLLHMAPSDPTNRLHRALTQVQGEFLGGRYQSRPCRLRLVPLRDRENQRLVDITTKHDIDNAWRAIHAEIGELKQQNREVHLCVSGGRRLMGFLAMSVAALHFRGNDRVWHLYTPDLLRTAAGEGAILHAPPDGPQPVLLDVPIMPGSDVFPFLRQLLSSDPSTVLALRQNQMDEEDYRRCQRVWNQLKPRPKEVLVRFARGDSPQEVAEKLSIAPGTVSTHLYGIYGTCREVWEMPEDAMLDYRWLARHFGHWPGLPE